MGAQGGNDSSFLKSREGFPEEVTFGLGPEGCAGVPQVDRGGNGIPAQGNRMGKGTKE